MRAAVFPQETGLDELCPGDQSITPRMQPDHRLVGLAPVLAAISPVASGAPVDPALLACASASLNISRSSTLAIGDGRSHSDA